MHREGGADGTTRVRSGKEKKELKFPTFSTVVPESSAWSRDSTPPAPGSLCPAQKMWDQLADGQKVLSLSFQQDPRLSGSKRKRGPHARCPRCPQISMLPATQGGCLRSVRASSAWLTGIRVLSTENMSRLALPCLKGLPSLYYPLYLSSFAKKRSYDLTSMNKKSLPSLYVYC